jgi:hypothetical protein
MRAVFRSKYTIRRFFVTYLAILASLSLVLWVLTAHLEAGSSFREALTTFFGNFAAAVAIFIVTYSFYLFVTPPGLRNAEVLPLRSAEIADEIVDLRAEVSDYWFWGRSGSYFRAAVLPRLDDLSLRERRHITVRIVVPDPDAPGNTVRYACMRRGLGEEANEQTLAANVLATVAAAVVASARNPYLHVRVGLCATVPVVRYDVSTSGALITRDARTLPAILVNAGNPYFEMLRDAVENELAQSRTIKWNSAAPAFHQAGQVSIEAALSAIDGLPSSEPAAVALAATLLASKAHRYA